jgi:hypothetical protein
VTAIAGAAFAFGPGRPLPGWEDDEEATEAGRMSDAGLIETWSLIVGDDDNATALPCREMSLEGPLEGIPTAPGCTTLSSPSNAFIAAEVMLIAEKYSLDFRECGGDGLQIGGDAAESIVLVRPGVAPSRPSNVPRRALVAAGSYSSTV